MMGIADNLWKGANRLLRKPEGSENIGDLAVFDNGTNIVSVWEVDDAEIMEIIRTRRIAVSIMSRVLPPHYAGSLSTTRALIADKGVWKK
jgi:hypothetical protein